MNSPHDPFGQQIEDAQRKAGRFDRVLRELKCADQVNRNSLIKSQESLSRLIKETVTPPGLTFPKNPMQWLDDLRIPVTPIEKLLPKIRFPEPPEARTLAELQQMSDDEIQAFLSGNVSINTVQLAVLVLKMRHLERVTQPHWSVLWTFWLVVASLIVTAIGIVLAIR